jgi:hypothetical protein
MKSKESQSLIEFLDGTKKVQLAAKKSFLVAKNVPFCFRGFRTGNFSRRIFPEEFLPGLFFREIFPGKFFWAIFPGKFFWRRGNFLGGIF